VDDVLKGETGALFLFLYLLPGFLGAVVYDYLVERESPSNFDRIIEALVLTLASSVVAHVGFGVPLIPNITLAKDTPLTEVLGAFLGTSILYIALTAVIISVIFAFINNHNIIYWILNRTRLTYKNGDGDVWQDTFYKHRKFWISIKFEDGRSLIGWPQYYSPTGKPRELFVADATWWLPDSNGNLTSVDVAGAGVYISDFTKVTAIEVLDGR
jgi:hypothetical protein